MKKARISEIFFSLQGEGPYVGTSHVFVRFFGCNIECRYCDTKLLKYREYTADALVSSVRRLAVKYRADFISLTGGEPLLAADFIKEFLEKITLKKQKIFLETNGILSADFLKIKKHVDIVAMDIKLPSSTGIKGFWNEHEEFLNRSLGKEVFIKAVITSQTKLADVIKAAKIIDGVNRSIPLILQSDYRAVSGVFIKRIIGFQVAAKKYLSDVRIIPQMHRMLGIK
ncbi:MAG: 7-carboxy-7-deazaguanine synthase QueE [Candidatus Omnitrophica bacterium]|nr:7-carboxy-7-deazaguanine synthase QueE [Candidatus Omnitrophota bacterium]